jgi:hypothetical protein
LALRGPVHFLHFTFYILEYVLYIF